MDNLSGEDDTAIAVWGTNWRMPSVTEINGFPEHCYLSSVEVNGVGCYLFRGKGYYYVNCLILPKVYDYDFSDNQWIVGSYGDTEYWTSTAVIHPVTLAESANALNLNDYVLSDFHHYWNDDYAISRGYLRPVRPVLSEEADPTNGSVAINEYPNIAEWVQLWPGGPKFSNTHYEYKGQWSLTGPDDMAATHWGPDWRVATQEQMNELLKAARGEDSRVSCTLEYRESEAMYYFCFKGKDPGYTDNCLYLKATYRDSFLKEVAAYYWSGTSPCEDCGSLMSIFWYNGQPDLRSCNWLIEGAVSYYDILPVYKN